MQSNLVSITNHLTTLVGVTLRAFAGTLFCLMLLGVIIASLSYYLLNQHHWFFAALAFALALVEAIIVGVLLGIKRATVMALTHAFGSLRLGQLLVRLIFENMLGIAETTNANQPAATPRHALEFLPLAHADELLSNAVRRLTGENKPRGWVRRKINTQLLLLVKKYTLARFREEGARHGGINLLKMKQELEQNVDAMLIEKVQEGLQLWTIFVIAGLLIFVALQTGGLMMLPTLSQ